MEGRSNWLLAVRSWFIPVVVVLLLIIVPMFVSPFVTTQIIGRTLWFGIIVASFVFLSAYCGMMSLLQTTFAGISGFTFGFLTIRAGWDPWLAVSLAILLVIISGIVFGIVSVRSYGSYFFMITLAIAILVYYFAFEFQGITGGHDGLNGIPRPAYFVGTSWDLSDPLFFYYLSLLAAVISYVALKYVGRSSLGLALRGIRDNHERMEGLGFNVSVLRVAGFAIAAIFAAIGGLFSVWHHGNISPGSMNFARIIDVVVAAVIGGLYLLEGAWVGAFIVTVLANYASTITGRFNTLIGITLIVVVLLFPDGLAGAIGRWRRRLRPK